MARATSGTMVSGSTIYSYVEVDGWSVRSDRVNFNARGGVTSPYNWELSCTSQLKYWQNGGWGGDLDSGTKTFYGYGDLEIATDNGDFFWRQEYDRNITFECYTMSSLGNGSATLEGYVVPHLPSAPSNLTVNKVDDSTITLQWSAPSRSYDRMCIEVAVDGSWQGEIAVLSNSATTYQWSGMAVGHTYQFRARAFYQNAYSNYDTCPTVIYTSPLAPTSITASAVTGSTDVSVTLENTSQTSNRLDWQVTSDDAGTDVLFSGHVDGELGTPITSLTIQGIQGEAYIWVRNVHYISSEDHQESSWIRSSKVITICPPLAPSLVNLPEKLQAGNVTLAWAHNWIDGSAQRKWQLRYKIGEGSFTVVNSTEQTATNPSYVLLTSDGQTITWQVRTWGAATTGGDFDDGSSPWSETNTFTAYSLPSLTFQSPSDEIHVMPLIVDVSFTDTHANNETGVCNEATVYVKLGSETQYKESATISGGTIIAIINTNEFLPKNNTEYTVIVEALSSTTLRNTAQKSFTAAFTEPTHGNLQVTNDPDNGYVSLIATFDNSASEVEYSGSTNAQYESSDGYVRSLTVEGNSEKWNQRAQPTVGTDIKGLTVSVAADGTVTMNGTTTSSGNFMRISPNTYPNTIEWSSGRVYAIVNCPLEANKLVVYKQLYNNGTWVKNQGTTTDGIITITDAATANRVVFNLYVYSGVSFSSVSFKPLVVDLTAIFGAGNEPATVDAFKATDVYKAKLAAGELYDYDAGSLVSIEGVSVGDGTITTPLRSAGSVHDTLMADADSWTVGRKVGYVDLGSLTWTKSTYSQAFIFKSAITGIKRPSAQTPNQVNALCTAIGKVISWNLIGTPSTVAWDFAVSTSTDDIAFGFPNSYTDISDAAAFKTAMSGVYLFYELATPTVDPETSMSRIEIGSAFTVATDLDSTFEMTTWDGSADAVSVSVSRVNADGTITPLLTDGASGSGIVDKYAPLNTPYQYAVITKAESQAVNIVYVDSIFNIDRWYVYWGLDNVIFTEYTSGGVNGALNFPNRKRVFYSGRKDPVSYNDASVDFALSTKVISFDRADTEKVMKLMYEGARGVVKSSNGYVYHADFDFGFKDNLKRSHRGELSITAHKIDGAKL